MSLPGLQRYRGAVAPQGDLFEFPIHQLDRIGIPVVTASLWAHDGSGGMHGTGYGTTEDEAARGALGELVEGRAAHVAVQLLPRERASHAGMVAELGARAVLDPRRACLPAGSPYTERMELLWVPARSWPDGDEVWVPIELAATCHADLQGVEPPSGAWLTVPITNGLGAGESVERALSHGLLELLQRDGNSVAYRALDHGVVVDVDEARDPDVRDLLGRFDEAGIDVLVKLAATDFGMANVYVVGRDRDPEAVGHPLMVTSCGEAVHPDRERAVRKALLEYASSRSRKAFSHMALEQLEGVAPPGYLERARAEELFVEESRSLDAMLDWLRRGPAELLELMAPRFHAERRRVPLSGLPSTRVPDDPAALLEDVGRRLREAHLDVLCVDLTAGAGPGCRVVRAIVPGLEVETATYHRCGERNLRRLEPRGLAGRGDPPPGARPLPGVRGGWLATERIDRLVGELYPLYREPDRHVAGKVLAGR